MTYMKDVCQWFVTLIIGVRHSAVDYHHLLSQEKYNSQSRDMAYFAPNVYDFSYLEKNMDG